MVIQGCLMESKNDSYELLKELIGEDAAMKVAEVFAGSTLYIPKSVVTDERHRAIRAEYEKGARYRDLSVKHGYSISHIRSIIHYQGNS